jgi:poly-gamma-glutamate synthesis protein (capsule biosynthesis protein)
VRRAILPILWLLAAAVPAAARPACPPGEAAYPEFYQDDRLFRDAIASAEKIAPADFQLTGVTVPHHLLAAELVAGGIRLASHGHYKRIVLLFPDHFKQAERPFATTVRGFETVTGRVATDAEAARALLMADPDVEDSCLAGSDHGIRALLPFLAHYLPDVPVLPVAVSIRSSHAEWERLVAALEPLSGEGTLVLQSTDFSHYLPHYEARLRDQQTLNVLASGSLDAIAGLTQPDHMDSAGSTYVQTALQQRLHGARPVVLASQNSQRYASAFVQETTSHMVIAFSPDMPPSGLPPFPGGRKYYLAGDTFFGRTMTAALLDEAGAERVEAAVREATGGGELIVNLEGVLLPDVPAGVEHMVLAMPAAQAVEWFGRLNVRAAGLANNHATDIGASGLAETEAALDAAGIPHVGQGETLELPGLAIVALSDLDTNASHQTDLLGPALLDRLLRPEAQVPVLAFVHWGREFVTEPAAREEMLAQEMRRRGVAAIVGAHPHQASAGVTEIGGGDVSMIYSLGNFLFDQDGDTASGALAEVTTFDQGTLFLRQVPLPNLYDAALGRGQQDEPKPGSR